MKAANAPACRSWVSSGAMVPATMMAGRRALTSQMSVFVFLDIEMLTCVKCAARIS